MKWLCTVHGCTHHTSGYSTLCERHKRALRRHGDPQQTGVTGYELKPYRDSITARRVKNPSNPTWELLERRWAALVEHAAGTLASSAAGAARPSYERQTAEQLVSLRDSVTGTAVIDTALAMYALGEQRAGRFKSDKAFNFQLARRVRALAPANAGSHWSPKEQRTRVTYRDTPPKVLECLSASLAHAFGIAGLKLAELEKREAALVADERRELAEALKAMT
jgi:hypothetical protein